MRADEGTLLPTTIREHFKHLSELVHPEYLEKVKGGEVPAGLAKKPRELVELYLDKSQKKLDPPANAKPEEVLTMKRSASSEQFNSSVISYDHKKGLFSISPEIQHRIVCLAGPPP